MDARQIQRMNQQAEVLFGKDHVLEPNFAAPMPYPDQYRDPEEEELIGVEYAMCKSTSFTARNYYAQRGKANCTLQQYTYIRGYTVPLFFVHILAMTVNMIIKLNFLLPGI